MEIERTNGGWKKFPKHEQVKLGHHLDRLTMFYEGVLTIKTQPKAFFVVDVRKEISAVLEARRCGIPVIGIVDTNSDPKDIEYVIPANDDAVGSIEFITNAITSAYAEGLKLREAQEKEKETAKAQEIAKQEAVKLETAKKQEKEATVKPVEAKKDVKEAEKPKKPEVKKALEPKPVKKGTKSAT
jgi:small subunit ribosomal protein S2